LRRNPGWLFGYSDDHLSMSGLTKVEPAPVSATDAPDELEASVGDEPDAPVDEPPDDPCGAEDPVEVPLSRSHPATPATTARTTPSVREAKPFMGTPWCPGFEPTRAKSM
jgi:hypothetical protein